MYETVRIWAQKVIEVSSARKLLNLKDESIWAKKGEDGKDILDLGKIEEKVCGLGMGPIWDVDLEKGGRRRGLFCIERNEHTASLMWDK